MHIKVKFCQIKITVILIQNRLINNKILWSQLQNHMYDKLKSIVKLDNIWFWCVMIFLII
jgi:hypothetical protein